MSRRHQPNLLLIMCDQLRADVLGCYGNSFVKTPNIDQVAKRGVCFDEAYSQTPVCVPARHGLMSGQNPFELGLMDNSPEKGEMKYPLPEMIRQQGYATFAVGKMHFSPVRSHHGFDRMYLSEEIPGHFQDDDFLQYLNENGYGHLKEPHGKRSENYYVPKVSELPEDMHTTAWTAEKTCELIRNNRNRPFFIFNSFIKPHPPFDPCVPYDQMYPLDQIPTPIRRNDEHVPDDYSIDVQNDYKVNGIQNLSHEDELKIRSYYFGCVSQIDKQIGNILHTLEECKLLDDTLIIFTADHGEMLGDHFSYGKRTFYEASAKVPMIVSWPATLPQGERREHFAMLQDIYHTLINAAGGVIPQISSGKNLISAIKQSGEPFRKQIHGEFGEGVAMKMMLRWDRYKYIYHVNGGKENLYDLLEDPNELVDISKGNPEICQHCQENMVTYYREYHLEIALNKDKLIQFPETKHQPQGFLNQFPKWPETV